MVGVAADQQGAFHPRFARRALHKVSGLGEAHEAPCGNMRHRREPGTPQPGTGGDDVVMGDACRMVDEHNRARLDQLAQPFAGEIVTRRDFERAAADQLRDPAAMGCTIDGRAGLRHRRAHQPESRLREMTKDSSQNHNPP